jgi:hypothetical protein
MPLKIETRHLRSDLRVEARKNPFRPKNTPFFSKATLPQRGRVEAFLSRLQVRFK